MVDYKKMYMILCQAINKSLDSMLEENYGIAGMYLSKALEEAEEVYIETCE